MGMTDISEEYFTWMCNHVWDGGYSKKVSYRDLLRYLNDVEFTYILPMDGNRFDDGIGLRYHFGHECGIDSVVIANVIDIRPCSVLEMMGWGNERKPRVRVYGRWQVRQGLRRRSHGYVPEPRVQAERRRRSVHGTRP